MRVGILSDTHGLLDSRVLEIFRGVERILHAGDVGDETILVELGALAPVTAVAGNVDTFPLAERLRETEILQCASQRVLLTHQVGKVGKPSPALLERLREERPTLVVFGHTHAPFYGEIEGVRYLNPGAAGPRRFALPRTVALLEIPPDGGAPRVRFEPLDEASRSILERGLS